MSFFRNILTAIRNRYSLSHCLYRFYFLKNENKANRFLKNTAKKKVALLNGTERLNLIGPDISGQFTHPDVIFFDNKYYLVATPYTFSNELIENPWVFLSKDGRCFDPIIEKPLALPDNQCFRNHLSDPSFSLENGKVKLYYRKSTHKGSIRYDEIFCLVRESDYLWSKPTRLQYFGNSLIAPSFVHFEGEERVFFVRDYDKKTKFFIGTVKDNCIINETEIVVDNPLTTYCIWHVDVKIYNGLFIGLFDYMEEAGSGKTDLFLATSNDGISWKIKKRIYVSQKPSEICLYKSTTYLIGETLFAIISGIDKYNRWFLYRLCLGKKDSEDFKYD